MYGTIHLQQSGLYCLFDYEDELSALNSVEVSVRSSKQNRIRHGFEALPTSNSTTGKSTKIPLDDGDPLRFAID